MLDSAVVLKRNQNSLPKDPKKMWQLQMAFFLESKISS